MKRLIFCVALFSVLNVGCDMRGRDGAPGPSGAVGATGTSARLVLQATPALTATLARRAPMARMGPMAGVGLLERQVPKALLALTEAKGALGRPGDH